MDIIKNIKKSRLAWCVALALCICIFEGVAFSGGLDIFSSSTNGVDVEKFDDQFLIADYGKIKVVLRDFKAVASLDTTKMEATLNVGTKNNLVFKFQSGEQAETWLKSVFTDYQCLTSNGIEECK